MPAWCTLLCRFYAKILFFLCERHCTAGTFALYLGGTPKFGGAWAGFAVCIFLAMNRDVTIFITVEALLYSDAGLYLIHPCKVWSKPNPSSINVFAIFASSTSSANDAVCLSFFSAESQKMPSIFIPVHMQAFSGTLFSLFSSTFSRSIFAIGIPNRQFHTGILRVGRSQSSWTINLYRYLTRHKQLMGQLRLQIDVSIRILEWFSVFNHTTRPKRKSLIHLYNTCFDTRTSNHLISSPGSPTNLKSSHKFRLWQPWANRLSISSLLVRSQ